MIKDKIKKVLPNIVVNALRKHRNVPIVNYFDTHYERNVLISYIVYPFKKKDSYYHTNLIESLEIAKIFKNLGFNVDIYNYDFNERINYSKYNVIFGFGDPLVNSFYNRNNEIITIYYGTGMHICTQNNNTLKRVKEVYQKKKIWLPESGRIVEKAWSIQTTLVDAMITLGNEEVVKSYQKYYEGPIYNMPVSFYEVIGGKEIRKIIENKDYDEAKKNFLWFGGSGLIHKGLDLSLEYFTKNPDLHLHICGPIDTEPRFKKVYFNELYNTKNIHTYGFIDIKNNLFKDLIKKCLFIICPSCSEGQPNSVINIMANGLIPLVTKESGVIIKDFGYLISSINIESIDKTVSLVLKEENSLLKNKSLKCFNDTRKNHSIKAFSIKLQSLLEKILNNY